MKDQKKAEAIAAERVQLLSPLLAEGLDPAKAREIKARICEQTGISERTLRRYLAKYRQEGFGGLKPKGKGRQPSDATIPPEVLEQAILLRREVPSRSVAQLIQILEWEGRIQPGEIKRSTLQEKLAQRGYSTRHMRMYAESGVAARRFQQRYRNRLWHSDIKYGPYLPIGPAGSMKQVFLVTFIDDATRFVLHGEFYPVMDKSIVENCFRRAIQKFGVPESVYFDNGKQYRTKWMTRACSKLGIRLLFAKPYSPEATGKVERFNRVVDAFLSEVALEKPKTLERLNELFAVWLSECYQNKPHSALENKRSPESAFRSDKKALRFVDPDELANAFLHCETRKVDKSGCISFMDRKYEVGLPFIGCTVDVVYDPADITELTIEYEGHTPWRVRELVIGERAGKRPPLPEHLNRLPANTSRLLAAAEDRSRDRKVNQAPAVAYRRVSKEDSHV
ncbi:MULTISPECIES: DDE-type integrase/transposase/recombinase [Brevibacillus]|uniref:Transposase n=1 Tax=Brevibacillus composti TaxID=2796470 RepID=A0A7T5EK42_9BACL|nr:MULTISPECIES: DDE-type integrase/transposase/recombinase [Brevibacillus]MCM3473698.1 DDE-type integrase/transposase/recombinase [Brevibacillus borstelensis]MCM3594068.1 DDE-type integrase/transposase/recombinase [Brevibacillus borstelensis]QQE73753.1 transposase [Brevibacillus composti]QQE74001.1 transposase [Brevibacillus composti]QUO40836.1 transposase [Brevibacillus composti]